jgi:hypothetical protein
MFAILDIIKTEDGVNALALISSSMQEHQLMVLDWRDLQGRAEVKELFEKNKDVYDLAGRLSSVREDSGRALFSDGMADVLFGPEEWEVLRKGGQVTTPMPQLPPRVYGPSFDLY